jgi:GntR family transcriptional regulator/MocR family aminotransferase
MSAAIKRHLPASVQVDTPQGGLFLWMQLPDHISADKLLPIACEKGVNFAPGGSFFPDPARGSDWVRLNFAAQPPQEIDEGMQRLSRALKSRAVGDQHK